MSRRPRRKCNRRGVAIPEWACILGLLGLCMVGLFFSFGHTVRDHTDNTADGVADPSQLVNGPMLNGPDGDSPQPKAPPRAQPRPKGNNGVGNGEDPQPPGNPPINDGPGTGPGNPGNKGGAKK